MARALGKDKAPSPFYVMEQIRAIYPKVVFDQDPCETTYQVEQKERIEYDPSTRDLLRRLGSHDVDDGFGFTINVDFLAKGRFLSGEDTSPPVSPIKLLQTLREPSSSAASSNSPSPSSMAQRLSAGAPSFAPSTGFNGIVIGEWTSAPCLTNPSEISNFFSDTCAPSEYLNNLFHKLFQLERELLFFDKHGSSVRLVFLFSPSYDTSSIHSFTDNPFFRVIDTLFNSTPAFPQLRGFFKRTPCRFLPVVLKTLHN